MMIVVMVMMGGGGDDEIEGEGCGVDTTRGG